MTTTRQVDQGVGRRRFLAIRDGIWSHLPFGWHRWLPATLIGFWIINGSTFLVDISLLTVLYGHLHVPHAWAIVMAYSVAFAIAFVLNKWLNFESERPAGSQVWRYVLVTAVNFVVLVVGGNELLHAVGVQYQLGRTLVACAELVWMYTTMRWFVFARRT